MNTGKFCRFLLIIGIMAIGASAGAQDYFVTGSDSLLGNWDYLQGLLLKDDGVPPDEVDGDDIFTATAMFEVAEPCTKLQGYRW